jgi:ketosteroid isomerase-like protein
MRLATSVLVAVSVSLIVGCGKSADNAAQIESLLQADREWAAAAAAGDVQRLAAFWTEDAVNFFPGAPAAHGKQAIRELVSKNRSRPGFSLAWEPTRAVVSEAADIGYTWGTFQLSAADSTGNLQRSEGHYVAIWRKQADGSWKCEVESTIFTG